MALRETNSVALSIAKAQYIAVESCYAKIFWMKQQLNDYSVNLTKNLILHSRAKYINVRHHFSMDHVEMGNTHLIL